MNLTYIFTQIQKLLWPEVCPFCGKASNSGICQKCRKQLEKLKIKEPRCMQCGRPVRYMEQEYCHDCMQTRHSYDQGYSLWLHRKPVSQSIYRFKYHNQRRYAIHYVEELQKEYAPQIRSWQVEKIMPVPLHRKRMRKRGYNQAELIAEILGKVLDIPVDKDSLRRSKDTIPQKELGRRERERNMEGAFSLSDTFMPAGTVLLIDDIYTTGSTLNAAAAALKKRGVQKVYFLTISIGQG